MGLDRLTSLGVSFNEVQSTNKSLTAASSKDAYPMGKAIATALLLKESIVIKGISFWVDAL